MTRSFSFRSMVSVFQIPEARIFATHPAVGFTHRISSFYDGKGMRLTLFNSFYTTPLLVQSFTPKRPGLSHSKQLSFYNHSVPFLTHFKNALRSFLQNQMSSVLQQRPLTRTSCLFYLTLFVYYCRAVF